MKTNVNWIAYKVEYDPPCDAREFVGFYQTYESAEIAFNEFAEQRKLSKKGMCCGNIKHLTIEPICIQA